MLLDVGKQVYEVEIARAHFLQNEQDAIPFQAVATDTDPS